MEEQSPLNQIQEQEPQSHRVNRDQIVVPTSKNKLKACMRCHLLKTEEQWIHDDRCENCPNLDGHVRDNTTTKFENVVTIIEPSKSWIRKRLGLSRKIVPGAYAANIYEQY